MTSHCVLEMLTRQKIYKTVESHPPQCRRDVDNRVILGDGKMCSILMFMQVHNDDGNLGQMCIVCTNVSFWSFINMRQVGKGNDTLHQQFDPFCFMKVSLQVTSQCFPSVSALAISFPSFYKSLIYQLGTSDYQGNTLLYFY